MCDLETLHNALPHLRSFSIKNATIYGDMPKHIAPCGNVRDLFLRPETGHLWGGYFARKYTNLEVLNLDLPDADDETLVESEAMTLARSCRHLKMFTLNHEHCEYEYAYQRLLGILREIDAPIRNLAAGNLNYSSHPKAVNDFCETVSWINYSDCDELDIEDFLEPLPSCSLLVNLSISTDDESVEVDIILDHCTHLQKLDIRSHKIGISDDTANNQHNLKTLILHGRIQDRIFPYLSHCCSRLSYLSCGFTNICSDRFLCDCCDCCDTDRCRSCVIYFPNPSLETLRVSADFDYVCKLTRTVKTRQIREEDVEYYGLTDKHMIVRSTNWFRIPRVIYKDLFCGKEDFPVDNISDYLSKDFDRCGVKGSQEPLDIREKDPIIWIECHSVDEIYLNYKRVRNW
ncbi:hypothetical protein DFQ30_007713 [Apophysomyces sp. BC1015]|nr:hypothetical protein DFQ30_007713 [Apophysomyces sp. BC1015]